MQDTQESQDTPAEKPVETTQDIRARIQALREQEKVLLTQEKEAKEKEAKVYQENMSVLTDTLAQACEGLEDAIRFFGGTVPLLLTVDKETGKAVVQGKYSNPNIGQVLSVGVRHGKVRIDGKEYPSLNSSASFLYPGSGKKGTEAWKAFLSRRNHTVEFAE